jgi:hypothetical protein
LSIHVFINLLSERPKGDDYVRRLMEPAYNSLKTAEAKSLYIQAYRALEWANYRYVTIITPAISKMYAEYHFWDGEAGPEGHINYA